MKTWKRLVSGVLSLALAASLTGGALAAEPKAAKTAGETAKTAAAETAKPAGQFSRWFPGDDAGRPGQYGHRHSAG